MGATPFIVSVYDQNVPVSGARVYSYVRGTSTLQTIYTDSGLTTPAANPSVSDSQGRIVLYMDDTLDYSIEIKSSDDAYTFYAVDYIAGSDAAVVVQTTPFSSAELADIATVSDAIDDGTIGALVDPSLYLRAASNLSDLDNASTARDNLGVAIGVNVQAYSAALDVFVANPLDAAELGQLQNIGTTTISATQWGYLGAMGSQPYESGDNASFGTLSATGDVTFDGGDTLIGKSAVNSNTPGVELHDDGLVVITRDADIPLLVNRETDDGTLILFRQDGATEGSINVSGSTVTYGGGHLARHSQLADDDPTDAKSIPKGTVMQGLEEMRERFNQDNEQLTRVKICDELQSKCVAGVMVAYASHNDAYDDIWVTSGGGDFPVLVTGDVSRGDLLESNGDGTARPQADDVVRCSTIAKAMKSYTGSPTEVRLVPCLLY